MAVAQLLMCNMPLLAVAALQSGGRVVQALGAEIVVAIDAATEHGDQFSTMHSYLPSEIHWGFSFVNIVTPARPPSTHHTVDIGRWDFNSLSGMLCMHEVLRRSDSK